MKPLFVSALGGLLLAALLAVAWHAIRPRSPSAPLVDAAAHARASEVDARFRQGVLMLHARRYEHALTAFHRVLELAPRLPEAHVNLGYALLGLARPQAAHDFFQSAIALRPQQANAYYGLALALEALGDVPGARGAMRTYLHLVPADAPHVRKARAALSAWQARGGSTQRSGPSR